MQTSTRNTQYTLIGESLTLSFMLPYYIKDCATFRRVELQFLKRLWFSMHKVPKFPEIRYFALNAVIEMFLTTSYSR